MKNSKPEKTAYAYLRATQRDDNKHLHSISDQRLAIAEYCKANNVKVEGVFIDAPVPASESGCTALVDLLGNVVLKPVDMILVSDLSRLIRSMSDYIQLKEQLKKLGIAIYPLQSNDPLNQTMAEMIAVFNSLQPSLSSTKRTSKKGNL